jgi:hypothetical protein
MTHRPDTDTKQLRHFRIRPAVAMHEHDRGSLPFAQTPERGCQARLHPRFDLRRSVCSTRYKNPTG